MVPKTKTKKLILLLFFLEEEEEEEEMEIWVRIEGQKEWKAVPKCSLCYIYI